MGTRRVRRKGGTRRRKVVYGAIPSQIKEKYVRERYSPAGRRTRRKKINRRSTQGLQLLRRLR